jgi:hypothetical protein
VTGVAFLDYNHGQTGVAPNAIELHSIIAFRCLGLAEQSGRDGNCPIPVEGRKLAHVSVPWPSTAPGLEHDPEGFVGLQDGRTLSCD